MENIKSLMGRLAREEEGAAASEYAILVALIAAAVALAVQAFDLQGIFETVRERVITAIGD